MKILQINASYKPAYIYGGPTMSVSKLSEQLAEAGCSVEVFTTTANGAAELPVVPNTRVIVDGVRVAYFKRLTKDHSHFSPALLRALWKEVRTFDLVHVHAWWNLVSVFSCLIGILRGVPVVVSPRGTLSPYSFTNKNNLIKTLIHFVLGKKLLKRSNLHVTSGWEKAGIEAIIQPKTITTIPNFIALPPVTSYAPVKPESYLKLIFFSRIEEKKGLDFLLDALADVTVPYQLTIAGDGDPVYIGKLKTFAGQNGVAKNLSWIGFQGENKFELLQQHDLMILASYDENFGNVVIESLSVGTAVLVSEHVGLADYVADNDLGWICELDKEDICRHINSIGKEKTKLAAIRQLAPATIRDDFDVKRLTQRYVGMYQSILEK